jgi:3-hydroxyacyl-CoA dehydrogenase
MYIYKAAVIGAGTMGAQIAQTISYSGLPVILKDIKPDSVERGMSMVRKIYQGRVDKGKMTAHEMEQKMALVSGAVDYSGFSDVDLVIEAVFEDLTIKRRVFAEAEASCPENTILATNTSSLPISALAAGRKHPEKVVGIHFFNPAHVMKLVEVIPGMATSSETVDDAVAFAESLRKIPVRVQECAGFLVNRLLMPYLNEAAMALQEIEKPEAAIEEAKRLDAALVALGMPMGPFALTDMIGLDVAAKVAEVLYDSFGPRMTPAAMLAAMVKAGRLGAKSGAGIFAYDERADATALPRLIADVQKQTKVRGTECTPNRVLLPLINEAVICLQEGVATASDIDVAMMAGTGFPQDKGGPLHYADQLGLDVVLNEMERLARAIGPRFWPAPMLKRMVAAGFLGAKVKRGFFTY